tara:strand:+ start:54 stop:452 length:399 start_codon:yes stop_codon:yes gene_type:complete
MKFSVIHINNKGATVGYRSDVGWACDPAVAEVIGAVLELNPKENNPDLHSLIDDGRDKHRGFERLDRLFFEDVKWYEGYHDVDMFNRLMEHLEAHGLEDLYGFVRIGEEMDDNEIRGTAYEYDLYINRSIDI